MHDYVLKRTQVKSLKSVEFIFNTLKTLTDRHIDGQTVPIQYYLKAGKNIHFKRYCVTMIVTT